MSDKEAESKTWGIQYVEGLKLLWWRENGHGYTDDIAEAGLFTEEEASRHNGPRSIGKDSPLDRAVPPAEMCERVQREAERLKVRVGKVQAFLRRLDGSAS